MRRRLSALLAAWCLVSSFVPAATAAVSVTRTGSENPMKEIGQSVFYGALTGLLVGSAVALADKGGNDSDQIRYGIVAGTFVGLAVGFWYVTSRPRAGALIELENGAPQLAAPVPEMGPDGAVRVHLVGTRF